MTCTIVIISYNGTRHTLNCLESLSETMNLNPDFKVIVVDNGSTDNLYDAITQQDFTYKTRLDYIRVEKNLGVAGGRNIGLKNALSSKYIMLLDNDTVVSQGAIECLVDYLNDNPDVGLAAPCLKAPDGGIQLSYKRFPGIGEKLLNLFGRRNVIKEPLESEVMYPFYVIGACQIFSSEIVKEIGFLDDKIFFGPEDADFCMRIRKTGKKIVYLPQISIIHDWQRDSRRKPFSKKSFLHLKGLIYFYFKWKRFF